MDTTNSDQVTAVYPSSTRYHAPTNGRSGVFEHQYTWGSVGIFIPPNTDFAILLAPVNNQGSTVIRSGAEAGDSPTESSAIASDDITFVSPATRTGFGLSVNNMLTRPGNGFILGNLRIYYHTTLSGILTQAEINVRNDGVELETDNINDAIDAINFNGGLEAVVDTNNPNIPIVRIPDLGVSTDKLADDAITNAKLADDAVASDNLDTDLAARVCPDPSTGTAAQVCARNTAGTAYELIAQTGGGGGGGDAPDPITLLDARAIPTGSGATQVILAGGSLTDSQVLSFSLVGSSGSRSYATALAANIRALTVQAAAPTDRHYQLTGAADNGH